MRVNVKWIPIFYSSRSAKSADSADTPLTEDKKGHSLQRSAKLVPDIGGTPDKTVRFNASKPVGYVAAVKELFAGRSQSGAGINLLLRTSDDDFRNDTKSRPKRHDRSYLDNNSRY